MTPLDPPDVAGFNIRSVWTLDRMHDMDKIYNEKVKSAILKRIKQKDFVDEQTFRAKYADYQIIGGGTGDLYSYAVKICGDNFVPTKGKIDAHIVDVKEMFKEKKKWKRYWVWKKAVTVAKITPAQT